MQQLESNVTLGAVSIIFVILIAGIILSVILLVVENCWYKLRHGKQETEVSSFKWQKLAPLAVQNLLVATNETDRTHRVSK